jgi:hypothetical protein
VASGELELKLLAGALDGKWKMAAQVYCNGPKDKYTSVVYKDVPV